MESRGQILEIYALNDVHGRFFNTPHYSGEKCASLANASAYLKGRRSALHPDNILLLDCGDNLQGDVAVCLSNRQVREGAGEHIYPKVAQCLGIDAVVPGNHDFEAGPQVLEAVEKGLADSGTPVLGANVMLSGTGRSRFAPYHIFERGGIRVAVIGLANPSTPMWIPPNLRQGLEFHPPLGVAQGIVDEIRGNDMADIVVLLLHSGFGEPELDLERDCMAEHQALALAGKLRGVDIIFAGHDHKQGCCRVGETLVLSGGSYANGVQRVVVCVEKRGGKVVGKMMEGEIVDLRQIGEDMDWLRHFEEQIGKVKGHMEQQVGVLPFAVDARKALGGPCNYVDLIHSVQLWASGAQVSFASPYMYDQVIGVGPVSRRNAFMMYSAENTLYKVWMSGRQIKDYLEYSYDRWIGGEDGRILQLCSTELDGKRYWWPKNFTYNFDSAAGLVYEVDVVAEYGNRVHISSLWNGEPFDFEKNYTVALSSYRVSGGGGMFGTGAGIDVENGLEGIVVAQYTFVRELLEEYLDGGGDVMRDRCGKWAFVPVEMARRGVENDLRLLFETSIF